MTHIEENLNFAHRRHAVREEKFFVRYENVTHLDSFSAKSSMVNQIFPVLFSDWIDSKELDWQMRVGCVNSSCLIQCTNKIQLSLMKSNTISSRRSNRCQKEDLSLSQLTRMISWLHVNALPFKHSPSEDLLFATEQINLFFFYSGREQDTHLVFAISSVAYVNNCLGNSRETQFILTTSSQIELK